MEMFLKLFVFSARLSGITRSKEICLRVLILFLEYVKPEKCLKEIAALKSVGFEEKLNYWCYRMNEIYFSPSNATQKEGAEKAQGFFWFFFIIFNKRCLKLLKCKRATFKRNSSPFVSIRRSCLHSQQNNNIKIQC